MEIKISDMLPKETTRHREEMKEYERGVTESRIVNRQKKTKIKSKIKK